MADYYRVAFQNAKKELQQLAAQNLPTELPVLDEIIENVEIVGEYPIGLLDVPLDQMVGTKTRGRTNCFTPSFLPILGENTEFAMKWSSLCHAHLTEGIREPVKAYEYMNKYYVQEGNKRVSVLKYYGADSIPAYVTRIVPAREDTKESRLYYESLDFYNMTNINYVTLSHEGSYIHLANLVGYKKYERWSLDDRNDFRSAFARLSEAMHNINGPGELPFSVGDALIIYVEFFGYDTLKDQTPSEMEGGLRKIWEEIRLYSKPTDAVEIKFDPRSDAPKKKNFMSFLRSTDEPIRKIAFINKKNPETSSWTYGHELGRIHLNNIFEGQIETVAYNDVDNGEEALEVIHKAVSEGAELIFTTTPSFMNACLKAAIEYPKLKIFNCSVNAKHKYVRTYYGRMFEVKFLTGVLAGIMTDTDKIGYIADYPIAGMTANINAFAIGVKMVNPKAKVYLEWSTLKENQDVDLTKKFMDMGVTYISGQDWIIPSKLSRQFGLYRVNGESPVNLATTVWNWGKYYELILRNLEQGSWTSEEKAGDKGVTYWWGISADVVDVIYSSAVPTETLHLLDTLKDGIRHYAFNPFNGTVNTQEGPLEMNMEHGMAVPQQIVSMNWLSDNIVGYIPKAKELRDDIYTLVLHSGVLQEDEDL